MFDLDEHVITPLGIIEDLFIALRCHLNFWMDIAVTTRFNLSVLIWRFIITYAIHYLLYSEDFIVETK